MSTPAPSPAFTAPVIAAPPPVVMTSYPVYRALPTGQQTKAFPLDRITPGDNNAPLAGGSTAPSQMSHGDLAATTMALAQGQVSLDDYQFHITPDGAGGSVLDGSASVHNHGPYDITDFQVSLREAGRFYVLISPGGGHFIPPAQGTVYTIHTAVPLSMDQLKTDKSFLLEAQLNGPPGLATDEESGTTTLSILPTPGR